MKKNLIYFLAVIFITTGLLSSCKKYEDGPAFSLKSKKARLTGSWDFEKVTVTSGGQTGDITDEYTGAKFNIEKDGTGSFVVPGSPDEPLTWEFNDGKEEVVFNIGGDVYSWKILRLKNKELWFEENVDGDVLEIHLKQ